MALVTASSTPACAGQHFWLAARRKSPLAMIITVSGMFHIVTPRRPRRPDPRRFRLILAINLWGRMVSCSRLSIGPTRVLTPKAGCGSRLPPSPAEEAPPALLDGSASHRPAGKAPESRPPGGPCRLPGKASIGTRESEERHPARKHDGSRANRSPVSPRWHKKYPYPHNQPRGQNHQTRSGG